MLERYRKFILTVCLLFFAGEANVLQEFEINEKKKKVKVAGCRCIKGNLKKTAMYRLIREQETLHTGKTQRSLDQNPETRRTTLHACCRKIGVDEAHEERNGNDQDQCRMRPEVRRSYDILQTRRHSDLLSDIPQTARDRLGSRILNQIVPNITNRCAVHLTQSLGSWHTEKRKQQDSSGERADQSQSRIST